MVPAPASDELVPRLTVGDGISPYMQHLLAAFGELKRKWALGQEDGLRSCLRSSEPSWERGSGSVF